MQEEVYREIAEHGGLKNFLEEKNLLLKKLKTVSWVGVADADIRSWINPFKNLSGLADKIIGLVKKNPPPPPPPESLIKKPSSMPEPIFTVIKNFSGADKHIPEKNKLIPEIATALKEMDALTRRSKINVECAKFSVFTGLASQIIALIVEDAFTCPSSLDARICDVIKNYRGKDSFIDAKNTLAPKVASAISGPAADRDSAITAAVDEANGLSGLDSDIIRLLPPIVQKLVKPATLDQNIFNVINNFKGEGNHVPEKRAVMGKVDNAIKGKASKRDANILAAVVAYADLKGLAEDIIKLLPPVVAELKQPTGMPDAIFNVIKNFNGDTKLTAEKSAILAPITAALSGPEHDRNTALEATIKGFPELKGLDTAIINLLPIPYIACPALVPKNVCDLIKNFGGIDTNKAKKNDVMRTVEDVLRNTPQAKRDEQLMARIPLMQAGGKTLSDEIIGLLPDVLHLPPTGFPHAVYRVMIGAAGGLDKFIKEKNILISEIDRALKGDQLKRNQAISDAVGKTKAFKDANLDKTIINLLPSVMPQKPDAMPQKVYDAINIHQGEGNLLHAKKTLIEKLVPVVSLVSDDRDDRITQLVEILFAREKPEELAPKIISELPEIFMEKPSNINDEVVQKIRTYKDATAKVKEKNDILKALSEAKAANTPLEKETRIRDILSKMDKYFGDDIKSFLVDKLISKFNAKEGDVPANVYKLIKYFKGDETHYGVQKALVHFATRSAIKGSPYGRDKKIRERVAEYPELKGLDNEIIKELGPVAAPPAKPEGMNDEIYNGLLENTRLDMVMGKQREALDNVQQALRVKPNFGPERDKEIRTQVYENMKAGLSAEQDKILKDFSEAAVKTVNQLLPK